MVKGVTTDEEGHFDMKAIPMGNYLLNISLLGYEPFFRSLSVLDSSKELSIEPIQLKTMSQQLEGVQVVGRKSCTNKKATD